MSAIPRSIPLANPRLVILIPFPHVFIFLILGPIPSLLHADWGVCMSLDGLALVHTYTLTVEPLSLTYEHSISMNYLKTLYVTIPLSGYCCCCPVLRQRRAQLLKGDSRHQIRTRAFQRSSMNDNRSDELSINGLRQLSQPNVSIPVAYNQFKKKQTREMN